MDEGTARGIHSFRVEFNATEQIRSRTVDLVADIQTVFPFTPEGKPKFKTITSISFEGFKNQVPQGFHKTATYGYGPTRFLYPLFTAIQDQLSVTEVLISKAKPTSVAGNQLILNAKQVEDAFTVFSAIIRDYREDIDHASKTVLHKLLPKTFTAGKRTYQKGGVASYIKSHEATGAKLSPTDVQAVLGLLNAKGTALDAAQVLNARQVIEEHYIEDVLAEFKILLARAGTGKLEEEWQKFFTKYNWIFSQLFSSPVMLFKDKAYVGGKSIDDSEGKVADFLYQNSLTKNVAIIEIKTHKSALLRRTAYRGADVFAESEDLSGAKGQVLNQRDNLQKEYYELAQKSGKPFETHNTTCVVLIGQIGGLDAKQVSSFELHRNNSKDVLILTFDEVYERLKALQILIRGEKLAASSKASVQTKKPISTTSAKAQGKTSAAAKKRGS